MNVTEFLGQIFFPRSCVACGISLHEGILCDACFSCIPLRQTLFCATCDARLPTGEKICHRQAPCMIGGATEYHNPIMKELVRELKFYSVREAAYPLAIFLARYLEPILDPLFRDTCIIIPIPLSRHRHHERGFNQAEEIAKILGAIMEIPLITHALIRTRHTKAQTETENLEERLRNLQNCFLATKDVFGKRILLIDDVTTSGTTFREAATTLKLAGARKIIAVAAAKA